MPTHRRSRDLARYTVAEKVFVYLPCALVDPPSSHTLERDYFLSYTADETASGADKRAQRHLTEILLAQEREIRTWPDPAEHASLTDKEFEQLVDEFCGDNVEPANLFEPVQPGDSHLGLSTAYGTPIDRRSAAAVERSPRAERSFKAGLSPAAERSSKAKRSPRAARTPTRLPSAVPLPKTPRHRLPLSEASSPGPSDSPVSQWPIHSDLFVRHPDPLASSFSSSKMPPLPKPPEAENPSKPAAPAEAQAVQAAQAAEKAQVDEKSQAVEKAQTVDKAQTVEAVQPAEPKERQEPIQAMTWTRRAKASIDEDDSEMDEVVLIPVPPASAYKSPYPGKLPVRGLPLPQTSQPQTPAQSQNTGKTPYPAKTGQAQANASKPRTPKRGQTPYRGQTAYPPKSAPARAYASQPQSQHGGQSPYAPRSAPPQPYTSQTPYRGQATYPPYTGPAQAHAPQPQAQPPVQPPVQPPSQAKTQAPKPRTPRKKSAKQLARIKRTEEVDEAMRNLRENPNATSSNPCPIRATILQMLAPLVLEIPMPPHNPNYRYRPSRTPSPIASIPTVIDLTGPDPDPASPSGPASAPASLQRSARAPGSPPGSPPAPAAASAPPLVSAPKPKKRRRTEVESQGPESTGSPARKKTKRVARS